MSSHPLTALIGLAAVAGGCSLINSFDDVVPPGGGGTGNQAAGGSSGGSGGAAPTGGGGQGGGGEGGAGPTYDCQPFGAVIEVLSKAELGNTSEIAEDVLVAYDPDGYVHVMATNNDTRQLIGRTVRDDQLEQLVTFPAAPDTIDVRAFEIFSYPNKVRVLANVDGQFRLLDFPKSGPQLSQPPNVVDVTTPPACNDPAQRDRIWGALDGGVLHVLGLCDQNGNATVFGTDDASGTVGFTFAGNIDDPQIRPSHYQRIDGAHVIVTNGENPGDPSYGAFVRFGNDAQVTQPGLSIELEPTKTTFPFAIAPGVGPNPSLFVLFASLTGSSPTLTPATLYAGRVDAGDALMFANDPSNFLTPAIEFANQAAITFITPPNQAFGRYASAGVTLFDPQASRVLMQWWTPEGTLLANALVDEAPGDQARHSFATAGRGNQLFYYVVWMKQDSADGQFFVQARRMACDEVTR